MRRPGIAVYATVFATAIWIDGSLEREIRREIAGDGRLGLVGVHDRGKGEFLGFVTPSVVVSFPLKGFITPSGIATRSPPPRLCFQMHAIHMICYRILAIVFLVF